MFGTFYYSSRQRSLTFGVKRHAKVTMTIACGPALLVACVFLPCTARMSGANSSGIGHLLVTPPSEGRSIDRSNVGESAGHSASTPIQHPIDHLLLTPPSGNTPAEGSSDAAHEMSNNSSPPPHFDDDEHDFGSMFDTAEVSTGGTGSSRGRHTRTESMKKRVRWTDWVRGYVDSIGSLLTTVSCGSRCSGCDVGSWATNRIAESCAVFSFGEAALTRAPAPHTSPPASSPPTHPPPPPLLQPSVHPNRPCPCRHHQVTGTS